MKDLSKLRRLRVSHYVNYDGDNFAYRPDTDLTQYTNVDDITLKRAPADTLEGYANELLLEAERKEQADNMRQAKSYDRSYVERGDYSIMTLYSDYKDLIEAGEKDWTDYRQERKKWRRCRYKFCLNMFAIDKDNFIGMKARRSDSRYCCDQCRYDQHEANGRYERHGTYMHVKEVEGLQADSINDRERENVGSFDEIELQKEYNKYHEFYVIYEDKTAEKALKNLAKIGE